MLKKIKPYLIKSNRKLVKLSLPCFLEKVVLVITGDCNCRCPVCFLWGKKGINQKKLLLDYINYENLISFFSTAPFIKPTIIVTGGEPLMYPQFKKIAEFFSQKKFKTCLLTNGELILGKEEFVARHFTDVQVSLDSFESDLFKTLRPNLNLKNIISGIKNLSKLKDINLGVTVSEKNFFRLYALVEFIEQEKIKVKNLVLLHPLFASENLWDQQEEFLEKFNLIPNFFWQGFLKKENIDLEIFKKEIKRIKNYSRKYINSVEFMPNLKEKEIELYFNSDEIVPSFNKKCLAPFLSLYIFPNGNIYSCPDFKIANIKDNTLKDVLKSNKLKKSKSIAKKYSPYPICRICAGLYEF